MMQIGPGMRQQELRIARVRAAAKRGRTAALGGHQDRLTHPAGPDRMLVLLARSCTFLSLTPARGLG